VPPQLQPQQGPVQESVNLLGGAYEARSYIANAQRCVNLYPERNPEDAEAPFTHYLTPGLNLQVIPPLVAAGRGLYTATNGFLYYVVGDRVLFIDSNFVVAVLGQLEDNLSTPVKMVDNGDSIILVDGTAKGYAIELETNAFAKINDPSFLGGDNVDYLDTFFVTDQPDSRNFYASLSNVTFAQLTQVGKILTGAITDGGSGYTDGVYNAVALSGGTGTGATADITVAGGIVTVVTIVDGGLDYAVSDVLSSSAIGAGSNFAWTVSTVQDVAFDPNYVAAKTGFPDKLATLLVVHREIWLFGIVKTTEVWYNAGGTNFPFQIIPGVFIEHGAVAKYSPAKHDLLVFWLGIDAEGQGTVYMGGDYTAKKISTPAIAYEFTKYSRIDDAIGMMYKQTDHVFYMLTFPTANKTWVYDLSEGLWHERVWTDPDSGEENRHRANCIALAYGKVLCGDWENGNLYIMDLETYNDNGAPLVRRRGMPHLVRGLARRSYGKFRASMECGDGITADPTTQPKITLRISRNRGRTFVNAPTQTMGLEGEYDVVPTWSQLGMSRDLVFELLWSDDINTALNGAYVDVTDTVSPGT